MNRMTSISAAAGLLLAMVSTESRSASDTAPDAQAGRKVYLETGCYACHGTVGQGGGWQGPKLAPGVLPLAAFKGQLREPARKMPRYSPVVLSDREVADIHAYLESIRPGPLPAAIKEIQ